MWAGGGDPRLQAPRSAPQSVTEVQTECSSLHFLISTKTPLMGLSWVLEGITQDISKETSEFVLQSWTLLRVSGDQEL